MWFLFMQHFKTKDLFNRNNSAWNNKILRNFIVLLILLFDGIKNDFLPYYYN